MTARTPVIIILAAHLTGCLSYFEDPGGPLDVRVDKFEPSTDVLAPNMTLTYTNLGTNTLSYINDSGSSANIFNTSCDRPCAMLRNALGHIKGPVEVPGVDVFGHPNPTYRVFALNDTLFPHEKRTIRVQVPYFDDSHPIEKDRASIKPSDYYDIVILVDYFDGHTEWETNYTVCYHIDGTPITDLADCGHWFPHPPTATTSRWG